MGTLLLTPEQETFIEHFGVKGQKWGVRRQRDSGGRVGLGTRLKKKLTFKPNSELTDQEKVKRAAKIVAGLLVADWAQAKIRSYTHVSVRAHNKRVVKNKVKEPLYNYTKKVLERNKAKRDAAERAQKSIKITANALKQIDYLDLKFKP